jgi:hypothetical protein
MNKRSTWILIIAGAVSVGIILACLVGGLLFPWSRSVGPATVAPGPLQGYASNGETIYKTLTSEEMEHEGEEIHPPYTDETIKRAITEGIEPDGEPMDLTMPRWQMSERDLDDLLEFLKMLD